MENNLEIARFSYQEQAKRLIEFGKSDPATRSTLSNRHVAEIVGDQERRIAELEAQRDEWEELFTEAGVSISHDSEAGVWVGQIGDVLSQGEDRNMAGVAAISAVLMHRHFELGRLRAQLTLTQSQLRVKEMCAVCGGETVLDYKAYLDAIAEALHPNKPVGDGWTYLPDQLAGMVRELRDALPRDAIVCLWCGLKHESDTRGDFDALRAFEDTLREHSKVCAENPMRKLEREVVALRGALEPIVKMLRVGENTGIAHLELDGIPAFRPIERDMRDKLGTLFTYLYNARVILDAAHAASGEPQK